MNFLDNAKQSLSQDILHYSFKLSKDRTPGKDKYRGWQRSRDGFSTRFNSLNNKNRHSACVQALLGVYTI